MFVTVVAMAVTMTMAKMRMAVAMNMVGGLRCARDGSRRAIVRVIPVIMVMRVRMHSRCTLFYARSASRRSAAAYLVDILTRRGCDFVDGV